MTLQVYGVPPDVALDWTTVSDPPLFLILLGQGLSHALKLPTLVPVPRLVVQLEYTLKVKSPGRKADHRLQRSVFANEKQLLASTPEVLS